MVLTDQASDARASDQPRSASVDEEMLGPEGATTTAYQTVITEQDSVTTAEQFISARTHAVTADGADGRAAG
jgi:hypothetical protein